MRARDTLARVLAIELPALEDAIEARDLDQALAQAAAVRGARLAVRNLLGGGAGVGELRAEWSAVEARIDLALMASPRPGADPEDVRRRWMQRLARGTGSPSPTGARGTVAPDDRRTRDVPPMAAIENALRDEVYLAPARRPPSQARPPAATPDDPGDPPTVRRPRRRR